MLIMEAPANFFIVWAKDDRYEDSRVDRVFNRRLPSRFPLAIAHPNSENDVVEAVRIAEQLDIKISVRSGGHSWPVWSVRNDAILIDLGGMNSIEYEDSTGIVRVGPATTGESLNRFLQTKGRMFNSGHCPTVGLGGFLYNPLVAMLILDCRVGWAGMVAVGDGLPSPSLQLTLLPRMV
jgi:FAD/FMN-containing dehydrogenase